MTTVTVIEDGTLLITSKASYVPGSNSKSFISEKKVLCPGVFHFHWLLNPFKTTILQKHYNDCFLTLQIYSFSKNKSSWSDKMKVLETKSVFGLLFSNSCTCKSRSLKPLIASEVSFHSYRMSPIAINFVVKSYQLFNYFGTEFYFLKLVKLSSHLDSANLQALSNGNVKEGIVILKSKVSQGFVLLCFTSIQSFVWLELTVLQTFFDVSSPTKRSDITITTNFVFANILKKECDPSK